MSRNSKNARLQKLEESLPKNRSAAARARAESGESRKPGRAAAPKHGKKNAWWQRGTSYSQFIKGGAKAGKSRKADQVEGESESEA